MKDKKTYSDTGFSRANGLCTLGPHSFSPHSAGRLSSNSCSAALICVFVLREEFAFLFQTFSRSDPPGKAPLTRGRYVFRGESIYLEEQPIRHPRIYPNWMCCETEPAAASDHFPLSKGENHSCCKRRRKVSLWPPWNSFRAPETQTHYVKDRNVRYWGNIYHRFLKNN